MNLPPLPVDVAGHCSTAPSHELDETVTHIGDELLPEGDALRDPGAILTPQRPPRWIDLVQRAACAASHSHSRSPHVAGLEDV